MFRSQKLLFQHMNGDVTGKIAVRIIIIIKDFIKISVLI